jgi:hypothetical protein
MWNKRLVPAAAGVVVFLFMLEAFTKAFFEISIIEAPVYGWVIAAALAALAAAILKGLFARWPDPMPLGRAYAAAYALLLLFLLCVLFELGGGFTDGTTRSYTPPAFIAALASAQLYLVAYIWLTVYRTRGQHPRAWLRFILHFLCTAPFLANVLWLGYFVGDGFTHELGSRDSNSLVFIVAANAAFWLWLRKSRSTV